MNDATTTITELKNLVERFVAERHWEPYHDPKNLSASIAIEAAELMEHFQWVRSEDLSSIPEDEGMMDQIREELADILAYTLSFASSMNIDLSSSLGEKMKKNATKYPAAKFRGRYKA